MAPVIVRMCTRSKWLSGQVQSSSASSISNLTFGGTLWALGFAQTFSHKASCQLVQNTVRAQSDRAKRYAPCWLDRTQICCRDSCTGKLLASIDGPNPRPSAYVENLLRAFERCKSDLIAEDKLYRCIFDVQSVLLLLVVWQNVLSTRLLVSVIPSPVLKVASHDARRQRRRFRRQITIRRVCIRVGPDIKITRAICSALRIAFARTGLHGLV